MTSSVLSRNKGGVNHTTEDKAMWVKGEKQSKDDMYLP